MCVCVLRVSVSKRDEDAGVGVVLRIVADAGGDCRAQNLFWGFSIVGVPWHRGLCRMRRMLLCRNPGRSGQGLDVLVGPRTANWMNEAVFDGGFSKESIGR